MDVLDHEVGVALEEAIGAVRAPLIDDRLARRNARVLAAAQALSGGNSAVIFSTGSIIGAVLAPDPGLATVPLSAFVVGMWVGTLPVGAIARRFGRRAAFETGAACGVFTGLLCAYAVLRGSFLLFSLGTFSGGLYAAAHQAYRFAAADTASEAFRPKAISMVLAGGIFAAFVGPELVIFTKDLWPAYLFAASYLAQAAVALIAALVLTLVRIPRSTTGSVAKTARPLVEIAGEPRFVVAMVCGVASYGLMNLIMTAAPLAMVTCNHSVTDAALGIQWHIIAMYAPSFFTGALISRFGVERVVAAGLLLMVASGAIAISGIGLAHFWGALIVLGIAWNCGFVGATTMVTQCHRPEERTKVQAFNDFVIFGSMAIGSFGSGRLLASFGWTAVNEVILPVVLVAAGLLGWLVLRERPRFA
jgi:MFS family permease